MNQNRLIAINHPTLQFTSPIEIAETLTMAHVMLSFLGRVRKAEGSYQRTRYSFGEDAPEEPMAFFGWPLYRRLQPERLVILGTAGSMWDHLFEGDLAFADAQEDARLALQEAVEHKTVMASHLAPPGAVAQRSQQTQGRVESVV